MMREKLIPPDQLGDFPRPQFIFPPAFSQYIFFSRVQVTILPRLHQLHYELQNFTSVLLSFKMSSNKVTHWKTNWYGSSERKKHLFHSRLFTPWPQSEKKKRKIGSRVKKFKQDSSSPFKKSKRSKKKKKISSDHSSRWLRGKKHGLTLSPAIDRPIDRWKEKSARVIGNVSLSLSLSLCRCAFYRKREREI